MNNPEYWKNDSSYYASPKGSERALAFQEALNQAGGNPFTFRGLPYAGEQPQRGLLDPPPGGWTGGIDPNDFINNPKPIVQEKDLANLMGNSIPSSLSGPNFEGDDSDYFAQNYFRDFSIGLDGNPVYAGSLEPPSSEGKGAKFDMDGNLMVPNYAGESIEFTDPRMAGYQIPYNPTLEEIANAGYRVDNPEYPRFAAANQMGVAEIQHNPPSSVTGRYEPGQNIEGLLSEVPNNQLSSNATGYDKDPLFSNRNNLNDEYNATGYDKDPTFRNRNNLNDQYRENMFAKAMMNLSNNILAPDPFYSN